MKKTLILIVTLMLMATCACAVINPDKPTPLPGGNQTEGAKRIEKAPAGKPAEATKKAPVFTPAPSPKATSGSSKAEIRAICIAIGKAQRAGNYAAVNRLAASLKALQGDVKWVKDNPLGGEKGQRKMWAEIHKAGIRSTSFNDQRYVSIIEYQADKEAAAAKKADPPATNNATDPPAAAAQPAAGNNSPAQPGTDAPAQPEKASSEMPAFTPGQLVLWTICAIPLVALIVAAVYFIRTHLDQFVEAFEDVMSIVTSGRRVNGNQQPQAGQQPAQQPNAPAPGEYDVRVRFGPFRIRCRS